jgi:hypothetical protein
VTSTRPDHADADLGRRRSGRGLVAGAGVLMAGFVLGGLTSFLQSVLPFGLVSFANSASGWTLPTAILVRLARRSTWVSALLGAGCFVLLTVGYAVVSNARGFYFSPVFWSVVGVVVGPAVGAAAAWLRRGRWRLALGSGLLAGIGIGEGSYGLTAVSGTTSPLYWSAMAGVGLLLALWAGRRLRQPGLLVAEAVTLVLIAGTVNFVGRLL